MSDKKNRDQRARGEDNLTADFNMSAARKRPKRSLAFRLIRSTLVGLSIVAAVTMGDDIREVFNEAANADKPTHEWNINTEKVKGDWGAAISADYILQTGRVPAYAAISPGSIYIGNYYIDWEADDSYIETFRRVEDSVRENIRNNANLQRLIEKENWTDADQRIWDRIVSIYVQEIDEQPGLDEYRTFGVEDYDPFQFRRRVNDLSSDIDNDTQEIEYDCEAMSITELALMQSMANEFLSGEQRPLYYYVTGEVFQHGQDEIGEHAFGISVSPRTLNVLGVIEGTSTFVSYKQARGEITYDEFMAGGLMEFGFRSTYGINVTDEDVDEINGPRTPQP